MHGDRFTELDHRKPGSADIRNVRGIRCILYEKVSLLLTVTLLNRNRPRTAIKTREKFQHPKSGSPYTPVTRHSVNAVTPPWLPKARSRRRSRISIIAVVEPSCYRPVTFPVTEASPKHHRQIKHVQFFPRPLCDCLVTERSWARRGHVV